MARTLLELLQSRTIVDCDTMDVEVPKTLGKFVDCTSNQAIAYGELLKPGHQTLIDDAVALSSEFTTSYPDVPITELAAEIAMIKLQLEIAKYVSGFVHVQTNPYHSYDTEKTVADAKRIVKLSTEIDPTFNNKRICIKIPSTWEGLQACKILEEGGITTLATTLFVIEQAALAGEVGCHYIAPYVNELKVHFEPGFTDPNKAHLLCLESQSYYQSHNFKTQVLPASLTSVEEIMQLAGVHHITISPPLLRELACTAVPAPEVESLFDGIGLVGEMEKMEFMGREGEWRIAFTLSQGGEGVRKLVQAINIFCGMQTKLEALMVSNDDGV